MNADFSSLSTRELLTKSLDELKSSLARRRADAAEDQSRVVPPPRSRAAAAAARAAERQAALTLAAQVQPKSIRLLGWFGWTVGVTTWSDTKQDRLYHRDSGQGRQKICILSFRTVRMPMVFVCSSLIRALSSHASQEHQ